MEFPIDKKARVRKLRLSLDYSGMGRPPLCHRIPPPPASRNKGQVHSILDDMSPLWPHCRRKAVICTSFKDIEAMKRPLGNPDIAPGMNAVGSNVYGLLFIKRCSLDEVGGTILISFVRKSVLV